MYTNLQISFAENTNVTPDDTQNLKELGEILEEELRTNVIHEKNSSKGIKALDPNTLSLIGLSFQATILALQLWNTFKKEKKKDNNIYHYTILIGDEKKDLDMVQKSISNGEITKFPENVKFLISKSPSNE